MIDPYYRVKSEIYRKRPATAICCFLWMLLMGTIAGFFGYFLYNVETNTRCFVKEDEYKPVNPVPIGVDQKDSSVSNVSYQFELIISMFFVQAVTGAFISCFSVISMTLVPSLLKFEYYVGIFNRLNLVFGTACLFFMHYFRLSQEGKVCSGDYLENQDQISSKDGYLIQRGELLWWYINTIWISLGSIILIIIAVLLITLYSLRR